MSHLTSPQPVAAGTGYACCLRSRVPIAPPGVLTESYARVSPLLASPLLSSPLRSAPLLSSPLLTSPLLSLPRSVGDILKSINGVELKTLRCILGSLCTRLCLGWHSVSHHFGRPLPTISHRAALSSPYPTGCPLFTLINY